MNKLKLFIIDRRLYSSFFPQVIVQAVQNLLQLGKRMTLSIPVLLEMKMKLGVLIPAQIRFRKTALIPLKLVRVLILMMKLTIPLTFPNKTSYAYHLPFPPLPLVKG